MEAILTTVNVTVKDINSQVVKSYQLKIEENKISEIHRQASEVWSEYWVNFKWGNSNPDQQCFIYGYPHQQKLDEQRLNNGEIAFEEYAKKWYNY